MTIEMVVLGCDGGYPGAGGAGSGYLVRAGATAIWLDAGPGTLGRLQREIPLERLDAVVITHEHPDHRGDLDGLAVALRFGPVSRRVPVIAPASVRSFVYYDWDVLSWRDVTDGDSLEVGNLGLTFSRTDHGPETLAVRLDSGGSALGYSADSGPGWSFEALGSGIDMALSEATYLRDMEGGAQHLSGRQAGAGAAASGIPRLVITHRWPSVPAVAVADEASCAFGAGVEVATSGARFVVSRPGNVSGAAERAPGRTSASQAVPASAAGSLSSTAGDRGEPRGTR